MMWAAGLGVAMCGRIVWRFDRLLQQWVKDWLADDAAYQAALQAPQVATSRYNITPGSRVPVATIQGDRRALELAKWAFPLDGRYIFNTRIETAFESPMWRQSIGKHHCVVPVTGFYEWQGKQPHFIHRQDGQPLLLAGLLGTRPHRGEPTLCVSIVTCAPSDAMRPLHDRMPVVLEAGNVSRWLQPRGSDDVLELAVPAGDVLASHPVSTRVNDAANDGPDLLKPGPVQGTLM